LLSDGGGGGEGGDAEDLGIRSSAGIEPIEDRGSEEWEEDAQGVNGGGSEASGEEL
jgi:hypothetical protein